jgi:hypothetical protein
MKKRFVQGLLLLITCTILLSAYILWTPNYESLQLSTSAEQVLLQKEMTAREQEWKSIYEPDRKMTNGSEWITRYPIENQIYYVVGQPCEENGKYFCDFYVLELSKIKGDYHVEPVSSLCTLETSKPNTRNENWASVEILTPQKRHLHFVFGETQQTDPLTAEGKEIPVNDQGLYAYVTEDKLAMPDSP